MSWHPTLDDMEHRTEPHQPGWRKRVVQDPDKLLPLMGYHGCWCGGERGHDWPGKDKGAPHPRDWPGRVNGHHFR